jgi:uncharacterized membrane protein
MTKLFSIKPGVTLKGRDFKGLRGWAGKPLHPPLTDFPIASYILTAAFDVLSLSMGSGRSARELYAAGTYVMGAGALTSVGTILTGFWDWWKGIDRDEKAGPIGQAKHTQVWRTINWHATLMATATLLVAADLRTRLRNVDARQSDLSTTAMSVAAALLVSLGSLYGGELVYDFQFNVESLDGSTAWDETESDQLPTDRPQSEW